MLASARQLLSLGLSVVMSIRCPERAAREVIPVDVFKAIADTRRSVRQARGRGQTIGLVPTMGALHAGHVSLLVEARQRCGYVVVSVFVNPTQFGPGEDFERYPRPFEADLAACAEHGADLVFAPRPEEMYPQPALTTVRVARLTEGLCGAWRPGHFDGVATVVTKLFNIVTPDVAFFGEKDYQQLVVVRRVVGDLSLPIEIVGCPTVREPDGLAMSSRNQYLDGPQRRQATVLHAAMQQIARRVTDGATDPRELVGEAKDMIREAGPVVIEYVKIVDPHTLAKLTSIDGPARVCLAVRIGNCRLIDNLAIGPAGQQA